MRCRYTGWVFCCPCCSSEKATLAFHIKLWISIPTKGIPIHYSLFWTMRRSYIRVGGHIRGLAVHLSQRPPLEGTGNWWCWLTEWMERYNWWQGYRLQWQGCTKSGKLSAILHHQDFHLPLTLLSGQLQISQAKKGQNGNRILYFGWPTSVILLYCSMLVKDPRWLPHIQKGQHCPFQLNNCYEFNCNQNE